MSRFHKLTMLAAVVLAAGPALAQNCGGTNKSMTQLNIENKIVNEYTCVGTYPHASWNELLTPTSPLAVDTGTVTDYNLGPTDPIDPTKPVGTYTISNITVGGATVGILTYTYGTQSFSYQIERTLQSAPFATLFCPQGAGYSGTVNVQPTHC